MAAQALMKRGKRAMAIYVKDECLRSTVQPQLSELLVYLLDPTKAIDDQEKIDWCRCLLAGGVNFDEFAETVRKYDNATMCGLVWNADFVAYRCRTCGISPSMSLCSTCFLASEHTGHDFNMFRSQAGGACDCGDSNVMKQDGFCPRHGPHQSTKQGAPAELLAVAEIMMPKLIWRLIQHLRDNCPEEMQGTYVRTVDAELYLNFLQQLCDMGAAMRNVFTKVINNPTVYGNLAEGHPNPTSEYHLKSKTLYEAAVDSLHAAPTPDEFEGIAELNASIKHSTILDELLFWVVKFEFPQKLVTLLLVLLPDDDYKSAFTKAFVQHYSRISCALVGSLDRSRISNRVVHISVQLLSPEALARDMVENQGLLHIMLGCLKHMIEGVLTTSGLHECRHSNQLVVDCSRDVLKEHCYWPIVSDLINVLSHRLVAYKLMSDPKLLMFWFELISYFQGMNLNQRELDQHVDFEPETYYAAFSAELEICASTMWSMVVHCKNEENRDHIKNVIGIVLRVLQEWFEGVGVRPFSKPNALQVSFHLPLHRHLAIFLSSGVRNQGMTLSDLLPSPDFLQMVMIHLLQIQVVFHEIFAGMWVRNGLQIKGQAMTYVQCHFCNSMVDADIYMLQVCANSLDPDYFLRTVLERFHVLDLLTFAPNDGSKKLGFLDSDKQMPMLEGALTFLSLLLGVRTQLGMSEDEIRRLEMVTLLCTNDRTHSQLIDSLPEKCGLSGQVKDFESILKDIADYKAPVFEVGGSMQQGMYVPKDNIWKEEFNPVYVLLRAMYKKDFQNSMDRFTAFAKQQKHYKDSGSPWPPFRIPGEVMSEYKNLRKLLHCRTMHAVLFTLLYKALHDKSISDAVIYFTIHLLELALSISSPSAGKKKIPISDVRTDKSFSNWFAVDNIAVNLRTVIPQVAVTKQRITPVLTPREGGDEEESLFSLAPSALSAQSGHMTSSLHRTGMVVIPEGTSSEVINAVQALLEETANSVDDADIPSGSGSSSRVRSMGVSANMETKWETVNTDVSESMLTLLVKLHSKLSGKSYSYIPESERLNDSGSSVGGETDDNIRIGDGPFYIGKVLDKACRQCEENRRIVEQIYHEIKPKDHSGGAKKKKMSDMEERRRKARERQQKVMADFANKQKSFMEKMKEEDMSSEQDSTDFHQSIVEEKLYDCVICNQSTPSTEEKPIGLVALLQSTSVLGHRVRNAEAPVLPVNESMTKHHLSNCATEAEARIKSLLQHFEESSCLMSLNIGWQGGIHTQTCGHYVHLDCHKSYVDTVRTQHGNLFLNINKGEFTCPLCRQLCNSAVPIIPDIGPALVKPLPCGQPEMVRFIAEVMMRRPITPGSNNLTVAMSNVMEDLTKSTDVKYKTCVSSHSAESVLLFVCSVLRCNIESEILQRGGSPCLPLMSLVSKKSCLLPLLHVLSMHSKILTTKPYTDVWHHISGREDKTSKSLAVHQKEVPVLLKDPTSLLIQFVLTMPPTMDKEIYWYFVQALYNIMYAQALIQISLKFSEEERSAWRAKVKGQAAQTSENSIETLLGQVIANLYNTGLYEDDSVNDPHVPAICGSVWSPQSVESEVQAYCLPYLRSASVLQHHMYGDDLPTLQHLEHSQEFKVLCAYLDLTPNVMAVEDSDLVLNSASCVRWLCDSPLQLLQGWCLHLSQFIHKDVQSSRMMLSVNPMWHTPKLFVLPKQYDKIFEYYRRKQCFGCNSLPKDPAICLVCGRLLCFKEKCCEQLSKSECVQHSITCGGGLGIYLIVLSCFVVVIRGPRATIWGSVYLDEHGEEDRELKRGKPLYLCEERYDLLQKQWISHSFDKSCKRWIAHRDQL